MLLAFYKLQTNKLKAKGERHGKKKKRYERNKL